MRKLVTFAMLATMFGSLLVAAPSVSAGVAPDLPFGCDGETIDSLVDDGYELQFVADLGEDNVGGSGSQVIIGTSGPDVIDGGSGNDSFAAATATSGRFVTIASITSPPSASPQPNRRSSNAVSSERRIPAHHTAPAAMAKINSSNDNGRDPMSLLRR